jgi:hypothetical protein
MTNQRNALPGPRAENLTAYFLERASHYRFAAAMKTETREVERLCEVAQMFERMAHDTRRSHARSQLTAWTRARRQGSPAAEQKAGLVKAWADGVVRLGRFIRQGFD